MAYTSPSFHELLERVQNLKNKYQKSNPDRILLIDMLEACMISLHRIHNFHNDLVNENFFKKIALGAWIFCFENIAMEYWLLNPEFKEGYIFNSGSTLYEAILEELEITPVHSLNDFEALNYLSRFYHYLIQHSELFTEEFDKKNLNFIFIEKKIKDTIQNVFKHVCSDVDRMLKVIPTERSIDKRLLKLADDYEKRILEKGKKINPDRLFIARLGGCFAQIIDKYDEIQDKHFLSRSNRIKVGILLHIMQSITNEYKFISPKGRSVLYDLCCEALNINHVEDIDVKTRLACLTAYEFIFDNDLSHHVEGILSKKTFNHYSLDPKLATIKDEVTNMRKSLASSTLSSKITPTLVVCASLGALICSAPGYGLGYTIGEAIGMTDFAVKPKLLLGDAVTASMMTAILGDGGKYLAYYGSAKLIDSTLERAFAKTFQALGMLLGAMGGTFFYFSVIKLSYETLHRLGDLFFYLLKHADVKLAQELDPKIIKCLMEMPAEIFSEEKKTKLKRITSGGLFESSKGKGPAELYFNDIEDKEEKKDFVML